MKKNNANIKEYVKYSCDNTLPTNLDWVLGLFATIEDDKFENEYFVIKDNKFYGKLADEELLLAEDYDSPILVAKEQVDVEKGYLPNITKNITTTYGRIVINYIIGIYCFNSKIDYINEKFTIKNIENKYILTMLTDDPNNTKGITIDEYKKFLDASLYIESFSKYLSIAATEKTALPPKGLEKFKKETLAYMVKKYGEDFAKNPLAVAELEKKMLDFDDAYLKDDPSYGKLMSGKVTNVARKKMFLVFGIGNSFEDEPEGILDSLSDSRELDPKKLATYANDSRSGSYGRGSETQKGGVTSKVALRATSDIKILQQDCGSKVGRPITIQADNYVRYINRYMLDNGKPVLLTEDKLKSLIGKTIELRTPLYCHLENDFCTVCAGKNIEDYENGVSLLVSGVGGKILAISLSAFHGKVLKVGELDLASIK